MGEEAEDAARVEQAAESHRRRHHLEAGGGEGRRRPWHVPEVGDEEDPDDAVVAEEPPWRTVPGPAPPKSNPRRLRADVTAALARAFGGRLAEAQQRLEALCAAAPFNTEIRQTLAGVYSWRGWPRRALAEYELALAVHPENVAARVSRAALLQELGRMPEAEEEVADLAAAWPEDVRVQRLAEDWRRRRAWRLSLVGETGSGGGPEIGSSDATTEATLFGPLAGRVQPFLRHMTASGEYPEGRSSIERLGLGVELVLPGFHLVAGNDRDLADGGSDAGIFAAFDARLGDRWTGGLRYAASSPRTPLRGRLFGIDARSLDASLGYRPDERRGAALSVSRLRLSDGNLQRSLLLSYDQLLFAHRKLRLSGVGSFYTSSSSAPGGPYYSPERDRSFDAGLVLDVRTFQRRDRVLTHRFSANAGSYWQKGFGSRPTVILRYEQVFDLNADTSLRYGLVGSSRVFDGNREERVALTFSTLRRFP